MEKTARASEYQHLPCDSLSSQSRTRTQKASLSAMIASRAALSGAAISFCSSAFASASHAVSGTPLASVGPPEPCRLMYLTGCHLLLQTASPKWHPPPRCGSSHLQVQCSRVHA